MSNYKYANSGFNPKLIENVSLVGKYDMPLIKKEDVVMIAKQKNGELLWLERGDKVAGLIHIEEGHSENLKSAFGVNKNSIPSFIKNVIEQGKIVSNVKKGKKITRIYDFGGKHYVLCALGTNGFIVSVYPR